MGITFPMETLTGRATLLRDYLPKRQTIADGDVIFLGPSGHRFYALEPDTRTTQISFFDGSNACDKRLVGRKLIGCSSRERPYLVNLISSGSLRSFIKGRLHGLFLTQLPEF